MRPSSPPASPETLALKALGFLAESPENLSRFLDLSGTHPATLRRRAEEPEFLAAVLDFLLADEPLLTAFCDQESLDPKTFHLLRRTLPGA
jgi:hypothetical protein